MDRKAVVLAAGKGSRLAPITACVPKELLPIGGFPALHHVLAESVSFGVTDVMIVLSEGKEEIKKYFDRASVAKGETATWLSEKRDVLLNKISVSFAYQENPLGTGDAILVSKGFAGKDPVLVMYPDDILGVQSRYGFTLFGNFDENPLERLWKEAEKGKSAVLVREVPGKYAKNYGVVYPVSERNDSCFTVRKISEKPSDFSRKTACVLVGRMILQPSAISSLADLPKRDDVGVIPVLNAEAERGMLEAVILKGECLDIGSHETYFDAFVRSAAFLEK